MGYKHHYGLVNEDEDTKAEPIAIPAPRPSSRTSWAKILLSNVIAAGLGAAVTYSVMRHTTTITKHADTVAVAPAASTTTSSALPVVPSLSVELVDMTKNNSSFMTGKILDCGGNPQQAREKGCVYDVMMQDWVPEPCYDSVLTEKYLAMGNYTWYKTGDGSVIMSDEEMRKGEHGSAWMSTSYHKDHCVFSWVKIVRALRNNRGISQELLSYDHVLHCSHGALKAAPNNNDLGVSAPTNYARCALYDTWLQDLIPDEHDSTQ